MRLLAALAFAATAAAQQPFSLDQVLGAPFPTELIAAPSGGKIAWVANTRGIRNIFVAEPPSYQPRKITAYTDDDGQELSDLRWLPDSSAIAYVRGTTANPASSPHPPEPTVWIAPLDGSAPRQVGAGTSPAPAPSGGPIAFLRAGQIWFAPHDGKVTQPFQVRGQLSEPAWSPDGTRLAFTCNRGNHSLIGLYDVAAGAVRYLDPSTDFDSNPEWSPDGGQVAFIRQPSSGLRPIRQPRRSGEPWSIRVADAGTGKKSIAWTAHEGRGSVFRRMTARNQLLWAADGRIVFPWESTGWLQLYAFEPARPDRTILLTSGDFEVEDVALSADRRDVIFSSNEGDIDRRHLWKVAASGGTVTALTSGTGIEVAPAPTTDPGVIALLASDATHPLHAAIRSGTAVRPLDPQPADFPASQLVTPQQVIFSAADGLTIHGQLFLPPHRTGPAPAVVFFHGGSQRQMLLGWHYMYYYSNAYAMNQYLASRGCVVLSVNYRSGIGYGLDFREALHYGPSGASEYNDVQGAGVYLRGRPEVDPARIGVWGGSYGGYLTALALARASDLFKAGVDFHGVHNWATELGIPAGEPDYKVAFESSPMNFLDTWRSPVLLMQGDDDPDVQFNQTVMLYDALRKHKVHVEQIVFPDEVHDFLRYHTWRTAYEATWRFLDHWLK